jgi:hypothetical protein
MIVKKRKGISTFIATLLLMVLAVAAGVVIYAYTMGYLGGLGSPQTMGDISVDTWSLTGTNNQYALTAYVRNIGKTTFQLDQVYVNGVQIKVASASPVVVGWVFTYPSGSSLAENVVGTLSIPYGTSPNGYAFAGSITYDIKLIGVDNTQISFQVKK